MIFCGFSEIEKKHKNRVQDCLAFFQHKWILNNKFFAPILHNSSRTALADALSYAGQIIKSLDCGEAIMKSLNTLLDKIDWQRDVFMAHLLLGYNKSLKKLKFSSDIENIDSFSIYSNENLEQIIVEKGNKNYISSGFGTKRRRC